MCYQCNSYSPLTPNVSYSSSPANYSLDSIISHSESGIESIASQAPLPSQLESKAVYSQKESYYITSKTPEYFTPTDFLNPQRPLAQFVQEANQVQDYIKEAFEKTMDKPLPDNIIITICPESEMEKVHKYYGGSWSSNIQGFAIHGVIPKVFIKQGPLDEIMVTIGHEVGHVLSERLPSSKDEEAKAFAFSLAWMKAVKEHNIANLASSIRMTNPAQNGLHNVALHFVHKLMQRGKDALTIFKDLAHGLLSTKDTLFY